MKCTRQIGLNADRIVIPFRGSKATYRLHFHASAPRFDRRPQARHHAQSNSVGAPIRK